jgi:chromosome segregation ATPase
MNPDNSFVDLRLNRQDGQNQESFWPSFTDIMTVIVMIFVIAMVVLLLRNLELVNQLRATMEAERAAVELAKATGEEKESLALKLFAAENDLSMLRMRLMQLEEQRTEQAGTIDTQHRDIALLQAEKESLQLLRDQLNAENFTLTQKLEKRDSLIRQQQQNLEQLQQTLLSAQQQLSRFQEEIATAHSALNTLESNYAVVQEQLAQLQQRYSNQSGELLAARVAERESGRQLTNLQADFEQLKVKYDKLIRPARSPAGRYLVEVRYSKPGKRILVEYQTQEKPGYQFVSQEQLETTLTRLKEQHTNGLYIKVIFPEKSGLTFTEAWSLTSHLHGKYDYYFQGGGPELVPVLPPVVKGE